MQPLRLCDTALGGSTVVRPTLVDDSVCMCVCDLAGICWREQRSFRFDPGTAQADALLVQRFIWSTISIANGLDSSSCVFLLQCPQRIPMLSFRLATQRLDVDCTADALLESCRRHEIGTAEEMRCSPCSSCDPRLAASDQHLSRNTAR